MADSLSEGEILSADEEPTRQTPGAAKEVDRDVADMAKDDEEDNDDDDEAEYERFLERERREFEASAAAKRRQDTNMMLDDRSISTRRKVREMDAVVTTEQELDYGEDGGEDSGASTTVTPQEAQALQPREARKIWWPTIES